MTSPNTPQFNDLDEAMDRLFDRELSHAEREALSEQLSKHPASLARFRETTDAVMALREPIDTPDVTEAVLASLRERPGFVSQRSRRLITTGRLAVAAALLGAGAGVIVLSEYAPNTPIDSTIASTQSNPIDDVVAQLHDETLAAAEIEALRTMPLDLAIDDPWFAQSTTVPFSETALQLNRGRIDALTGTGNLISLDRARSTGSLARPDEPFWASSASSESPWQIPLRSPTLTLDPSVTEAFIMPSPLDPLGELHLKSQPQLLQDALEFKPDHRTPGASSSRTADED